MYERLQSEASSLDIKVQEKPMRGKIRGLYGDSEIWINKNIETTVEKACVLAEEIGHYHFTIGDILDQTLTINRKQERLARGWAFKKLVPLKSLIEAYEEGCRDRYEIAERLNVTEAFLDETLSYYQEKLGNQVRIGNGYILIFRPLSLFKEYQEKGEEIC